jgi:DNA-binding Lrp family transcriptional regulator
VTPHAISDETRAALLAALQSGLPLSARPFADLAREAGCTEAEAIAEVARLREKGLVRRFGAVFDTRRLGYRSALCAVSAADCDAAAAAVTPLPGVTHCYLREPSAPHGRALPALWFTLSTPADVFPAMQADVRRRLAPHSSGPVHFLPASRRYKVDVVFGAASRARDESTSDDLGPVSPLDRAVISALQGDTEVRPDYFAAIAASLGVKEWDLLSTLELWRRTGRLKRIGLLLSHRTAGYSANGMCCWRIEGETLAAGRALAERGEVTHCYERPPVPDFDYNLFAMVHACSLDEAEGQFAALRAVVDGVCQADVPAVMLVSTREYKKTSMTFFA